MGDGDPFLSEGERLFLEALNASGVRFLVVGMSAALLQGARGATEDIDLWFENIGDDRIGEAARKAGGFWATRMQPPLLGGLSDRFDVITTMSGLDDFDREYQESVQEDLDGVLVRLLSLPRILHSKKSARRSKDEPGIRQIEMTLDIVSRLRDPG